MHLPITNSPKFAFNWKLRFIRNLRIVAAGRTRNWITFLSKHSTQTFNICKNRRLFAARAYIYIFFKCYLFIYLFMYLFIYLIYFFIYLFISLFIYLFNYLCIYSFIYLFIYLIYFLFIYFYIFKNIHIYINRWAFSALLSPNGNTPLLHVPVWEKSFKSQATSLSWMADCCIVDSSMLSWKPRVKLRQVWILGKTLYHVGFAWLFGCLFLSFFVRL